MDGVHNKRFGPVLSDCGAPSGQPRPQPEHIQYLHSNDTHHFFVVVSQYPIRSLILLGVCISYRIPLATPSTFQLSMVDIFLFIRISLSLSNIHLFIKPNRDCCLLFILLCLRMRCFPQNVDLYHFCFRTNLQYFRWKCGVDGGRGGE